ncbi:MAG: hypothetical protein ACOH18_05430 [Candidatus Saccharimonadaceae bacterium]
MKKRTLRRQQKNLLIREAQQDIDTVEQRLKFTTDKQARKGLEVLLEILSIHAQQLINSEV